MSCDSSDTISKILFNFITNLLSVPNIYSLAIFENYVPKAFGSIFKTDPPVARLNFPNYLRLHLSPFKLNILTETLLFFAKSAAFS